MRECTRILSDADVNLWRYIPAQRRRRAWVCSSSDRQCCSALLLRHRKQVQIFGGTSTLAILRVFFHLKAVIGTLRLLCPGLVLLWDTQVWSCVDGFPPGSPLLCLLRRDVRPAVVVVVDWRFVPPAGGSWGDGQEIKTTYTIAPNNSWSSSYQLWSQRCPFLGLLTLKSWEESVKTQF